MPRGAARHWALRAPRPWKPEGIRYTARRSGLGAHPAYSVLCTLPSALRPPRLEARAEITAPPPRRMARNDRIGLPAATRSPLSPCGRACPEPRRRGLGVRAAPLAPSL